MTLCRGKLKALMLFVDKSFKKSDNVFIRRQIDKMLIELGIWTKFETGDYLMRCFYFVVKTDAGFNYRRNIRVKYVTLLNFFICNSAISLF